MSRASLVTNNSGPKIDVKLLRQMQNEIGTAASTLAMVLTSIFTYYPAFRDKSCLVFFNFQIPQNNSVHSHTVCILLLLWAETAPSGKTQVHFRYHKKLM